MTPEEIFDSLEDRISSDEMCYGQAYPLAHLLNGILRTWFTEATPCGCTPEELREIL